MILVLLSYSWVSKENEEELTLAAQKLLAQIDRIAESKECGTKFRYLNYSASWQDPITGYGEQNVKFLQDVAREYDPEGVFQTLCPGGFKVFK